MQFLSLYTPAVPSSGPPSPEHMAQMGKLIEEMMQKGVLVTTGGILSRQTGMKVVRKNGQVTSELGPVAGSSLMPAAGYALMRASSREELAAHIKTFLDVAGDGTCEIIQVMD
jgi:hypothetical protein